MDILYVSQHFPPEIGAASTRAYEFCKNWISSGVNVSVLTALPNYPIGKFYKGYEKGTSLKEDVHGIPVYRCKIDPRPFKNKFNRLKNYLSFFKSALSEVKKITKFDMVFATIGPIPVAAIGYIIAKQTKVPLILEFRDITSKQIEATKYGSKFVSGLVEKYELFFARKADLLVTVSDGYKQFFIDKGIPEAKVTVAKNGFDFSEVSQEEIDFSDKTITELLENKRRNHQVICGYFGTLGISQDILSLVKDISELQDIFLILIGQGAQYDAIYTFITTNNVENVTLFKSISEKAIANLYKYIDYSLSILVKSDYFLPTIPSKIFRSMGFRTIPVFMGPDGEAAAIVKEIDEKLYITSVKELIYLKDLDKKTLKARSYELCKTKYNRSFQAKELLDKLEFTFRRKNLLRL